MKGVDSCVLAFCPFLGGRPQEFHTQFLMGIKI